MISLKTLTITTVSAAALAFAGAAVAGAPAAAENAVEEVKAKAIDTADAAASAAADVAAPAADIVDTAIAAGSFSTLVAAVQAADLVDTLKGEGPFTVFAPTDEAFAALPEGTVEDLLKPENKAKLASILTYHVVPGKVLSSDLSGEMSVPTAQGEEVSIVVADAGVTINGANITAVDIDTSNGVIHVIDAVILPGEAGKSR